MNRSRVSNDGELIPQSTRLRKSTDTLAASANCSWGHVASQGTSLIFDKSSLESLDLGEAVLLDNFHRSVITPLFFVECLADLEKAI